MGFHVFGQIAAMSAFFLGAAAASAAVQATFYVAPDGSDSNKGTKDAPFKTITQAQKAVRAINGTMTGDIEVILRDGTYQLPATVNFTEEDGGKDGNYVRYKAADGETPLITGGIPMSGWTIHDEKNNIWKVEGVDARFRQLYVNNKKAIRARMPNLKSNGDHNFFRLNKVDSTGSAFLLNSSDVKSTDWKNPKKVEIHLMIAWAESILRLDKISSQGNALKFEPQDPERSKLFRRKYPMLGTAFMSNPPKQQVYYLENAYEFIDQPGEWYLDESTNTLYYKAREGENMATANVVAPRVNTLFSILGKNTKSKVGYMAFEGLTFAHTNYLRPSEEGFLDLQAGMFNIEVIAENGRLGSNKFLLWRPDAGFRIENAHHMKIRNCTFTQMAATGLDMVSGTNDDVVEGSVFYELGANGIMLGKFSQDSLTEIHIPYNPTDKDEISTRDTLRYNLITNVTNEHQGAVGIAAGYPRYVVIENNEVSYTNYSGISVGYGWTKSQTAMTNNHINKNNIHHISRLLCDSGPIYTLSNQGSGSEIKENYLHDYGASEWSDYWVLPIYLDEGSSGFTVENNSYRNAPSGVGQNQPGQFTQRNNGGYIESVAQAAGLQGEFKNIATRIDNIPLPDFSNTVPQTAFVEGMTIPGTIEMENYDLGGQSVSFSDKDFVNEGGALREDGVDIVQIDSTDKSKGYAIGFTQPGEWMEYTLKVTEAGEYAFVANVATASDGASFILFMDGKAISDTIVAPKGEDWSTYGMVDGKTTALEAGEHVLRVAITGAFINIDWLKFGKSKDDIMSIKPSVRYGVDMDISRSSTLNVFDVRGHHLGTIRLMGMPTTSSVLQQMHAKNFKSGVYFVQSANKSFGKMIQVR